VLEELRSSPHRLANLTGIAAPKAVFDLPVPPAAAPVPASAAAQKLTERTLIIEPGAASKRSSGSGARPWLLWTALAAIVAGFAIAAIVCFRPASPGSQPAPHEGKIAPEQSIPPPAGPLSAPPASNETTIRAIRFAAGLLLMGASVAIALGLRRWLGSRSQVKSQAYDLVFGARVRTDLTATIALQLDDLVTKLRGLDERILAGTVALMLEEYGNATDTKDRQAALMNVVALSEKLAVRLSPWYERHKEIIASAVALMGGVSGLMTALNSVLSHKH